MSCFTFLKVTMVIFNLLIFLCGGVLLGVGIWVSVDSPSFLKIFGSVSASAMQFVNVSYFLIAAGCVLLVLGFLGCYGAHKESKCVLLMFFSILLIIFIAEIAAAVVALVYTSLAENLLNALVVPVIKKDYGQQPDITQVWNSTMEGLHCCGFNNYTDFTDSPYFQMYGDFPSFCCANDTVSCSKNMAEQSNIKGCFEQLLQSIHTNAAVVGGVAAGFGALELAAMIVSLYLYCKLDKA
ncbi:tetraspanin-1 [Phascolarctos cinereus]|uniref:Tetraspanin n=1 Tax=Phascolarctos cinereus TaxID=38626 RepID=A0A6P5KE85_PHACI|nr:tetraspanin-1 [Phascolarctos cinereus]